LIGVFGGNFFVFLGAGFLPGFVFGFMLSGFGLVLPSFGLTFPLLLPQNPQVFAQ
jgi:hypothetical protein